MRTIKVETLPLRDGDTVLDLGCGHGRHMHALYYAKRLHAVGVDLGFEDLKITRKGFEENPDLEENSRRTYSLVQADAGVLPFPDATFDTVVCSEVLEHIPDYETVLEQIFRVLKPGGTLAVSVPRSWPEWICWKLSPEGYANDPGGHVRIFNAAELRCQIERRGLRFLRKHWAHGLHSPYWWLQCLNWEKRDRSWLVKAYHRFLVWDITKQPFLTRVMEAISNPIMGKSVVMYFVREG